MVAIVLLLAKTSAALCLKKTLTKGPVRGPRCISTDLQHQRIHWFYLEIMFTLTHLFSVSKLWVQAGHRKDLPSGAIAKHNDKLMEENR